MIRIFNPWEERENAHLRCVIGRHRVLKHKIFFTIDDKHMLCLEHALEIVGGVDSFYASKTGQKQILDAYQRSYDENEKNKREAKMRKIAGTREPGFVYYIRMDDLIKIGYAKDVARRMRAYPPSAELLAVHPGTPELERQMHDQFKAFLRRGREWFAPHEQVMTHIATVRDKFGDPKPFAYQYTKSKTA